MLCMAKLIDSLQTSQDFLRRHSLCCRRWGTIHSLNRLTREEQNESRALSRGPMTAMTGLLACAFHVYVLCQWMRDMRGKRTARPAIDGPSDGAQTNKRPYVMGSRKNAERHDSPDVSSYRATR